MSLSYVNDAGLAYLKKIGFKRIKTLNALIDEWVKMYGKNEAMKLYNQFQKVEPGTPETYEFKNTSLELSMTISETYDSDIIRKACNYIADNKECFGKTILEIGCDIGIMTGFLGLMFPESKITAIEQCESAVKIAKERMKQLGLSNVEILNCSIENVNGAFDSVFCMRTLQENLEKEKIPFGGVPFRLVCAEYSKATEKFTKSIKSCVKPDGALIVFERLNYDPLLLGWLIDLSNVQLGRIESTYREIECEEVGETSVFQCFICKNNTAMDIIPIFNQLYRSFQDNNAGEHELDKWHALVYLDKNAGRLIRGANIYDKEDYQIGRFAVFEDKNDDSLLYYLYTCEDGVKLLTGNSSERDAIIGNLDMQIKHNKTIGWKIVEIDPDDEELEGNIHLFE